MTCPESIALFLKLGLFFIIVCMFFIFSCSEHIFDNPLDPANTGEIDEYLLMFRNPSDDPGDLAWDGVYLWNCDRSAGILYRINPYNGSVQSSLPSPLEGPVGLTESETSLWVSHPDKRRIIEIDYLTGHELFSFSSPGSNPQGLTYDLNNEVLYSIDANSLSIFKLNPHNGAILSEIPSPSRGPIGLALANNLLYVAGFVENIIYAVDVESGLLLRQFDGPNLGPIGLTWDGDSLWVADWDLQVYRIRPSSP